MRNLPIAYGNSCQAKLWSNKTITWDALCEKLKTTIRTTDTVEEYPKIKKADKEAAKDKGGFVGGKLRDNNNYILAENLTKKLLEKGLISVDEFNKIMEKNRRTFSPLFSRI